MPTGDIIFDEERGDLEPLQAPNPEPDGIGKQMLKTGIVSTSGDAVVILVIFAVFLVSLVVYFIASAIPDPVSLGNDQLREGERLPNYVLPGDR
ncbi:MAG: hypothetical protein AAB439_01270 [Patescibacteria group bacterium]